MRGLQLETLPIYLDDIIIFSQDIPTHRATNYCPPTAQTSMTKAKTWQMPPFQPGG